VNKVKNGSALIVTLIVFMFLTTVSVAFLSMITTNYYGRVSEGKRTENLYGSESGLDTVYNIIAKTVESASFYGNQKVEELKKAKNLSFNEYKALKDDDQKSLYALYADIQYWKYYNGNIEENEKTMSQEEIDEKIKKDNEDIDKLINKVFKNGFKEFIQNDLKTSIEESQYIQFVKKDDGTFQQVNEALDIGKAKIYLGKKSDNTNVQENTQTSNENIKIYTGDNIQQDTNSSDNNILIPIPKGDSVKVDTTLKVESGYKDDGRIKYDNYPLEFNFYNEEDYSLPVTSEFKTDSSEGNAPKIGENLRIIQAEYSIRVPNYDEVAFKESAVNVTDISDIVGLTIGGDMKVSNVNKLNVTGNIFVQGKDFEGTLDNSNRTFEKYTGGIILNNSSTIKKTINFNDNVFTRGTFNIKNNVDAAVKGDLYARNIYAGNGNNKSDNSTLTINKEAVIDNDLAVKATNTAININDFYGINDKTVEEGTKARKSSSIIINDYKTNDSDKSSVTISDKAYIMGVAHINTQNGYQTGESVAVKGNYKAYSVPDPSDSTEKFKYDDPLQVLDEDDVYKKATHFFKYWKDRISGQDSIDCGGVILPSNTYSIGAIVYDNGDKVRNASPYDAGVETNIIGPKRLDFARNVYTISSNKGCTNQELKDLYDNVGNGAEEVSDLLNNIYDYRLKSEENDGDKFAMFSSDPDKTIVIKGNNSTGTSYDDNILIDARNNKDVKAVIVTKGKVIIDGDVNFRGDIIAGNNLEVLGNSQAAINIYYDKNLTEEIQNSNSSIFNGVFGNNFGGETLSNETLNIQSNSSSFLKTKLWKIIQ
jgi:hypothetical protein